MGKKMGSHTKRQKALIQDMGLKEVVIYRCNSCWGVGRHRKQCSNKSGDK